VSSVSTVTSDIGYLHHVGHVVRDMEEALERYRRLGFVCPPPAYPTLSRDDGAPPRPFGAANTHAAFGRNFVEIVTVVTGASRLPDRARLVPLRVPPAALQRVVESIERTVAKVSASLARFEGLHILVFQTEDADASVSRFDEAGVGHSGVTTVQRPIETATGEQMVPTRVVEIDREDVPEGRLAVAENPDDATLRAQPHLEHPNGAVDLVESILCVPGAEIDAYVARYQRYLGRAAGRDGAARVFDLRRSRLRLAPADALGVTLPGETAPALPAFVGYAVAVRDLAATRRLLEGNGLTVREAPSGEIFVPAEAALGAAVIFRQAR
jgi:Glyoxalase-like domain